MVQFEQALKQKLFPDWSPYYLNYSDLKIALKNLKNAYDHQYDNKSSEFQPLIKKLSYSSNRSMGNSETDQLEDNFSSKMDDEVEKVVLFFLEQQGNLAHKLRILREHFTRLERAKSSPQKAIFEEEIKNKILNVGNDLLKLLLFLELNVSGLRKILKKHDKQIRKRLLAAHYLVSRARNRYSYLLQLYHNEGILALVGSLNVIIDRFQPLRQIKSLEQREDGQSEMMEKINDSLVRLKAEQDRTLNDYVFMPSDFVLEAGMGSIDELSEEEMEAMKKRKLDPWSAYLNLTSTFLYMTNYYIVGPTSTQYAKALGSDAAFSGIIIGMTPIAACLSCAVYSYWTNKSFKRPLLLCNVLLIAGNMLYGLALEFDALWMALLGRVLIGLGGARGINRRYIADTVPFQSRTFFSSAFVAVGAVGMAFGPVCAAFLNQIDFQIGVVKVNGMTGPGWFMFSLWVIVGIVIVFKFKDPPGRFLPGKTVKIKKMEKSSSQSSEIGLLNGSDDGASCGSSDEGRRKMPLPLSVALYSYFINKLLTEAAVSSAPLITSRYFDWDVTKVGMLMAAMGLITLPVSMFVGKISSKMEDRFLLQCLSGLVCVSCLAVITEVNDIFDLTFSLYQYVIGIVILFVALQAHEGVLMSITGKIIPSHLAKGTFNSGFLATEAGTSARFSADIAITLIGVGYSGHLLDIMFVPGVVFVLSMIIGIWHIYPYLDV